MSIQALNKQFRHLPECLIQRIRKRRRILKNRKYALKCRKKGSEKTDNITEENTALELEIFKAKEELRKVTSERDEYKLKYVRLSTTFDCLAFKTAQWRSLKQSSSNFNLSNESQNFCQELCRNNLKRNS
ncbi:hypothetical protein OS493_005186 [Desmophyllum pertusum]|uniref:Basic leucine zipper domain-containing protein n=1 Tax=Desmophyllum pertusum TaxID=174260 RepID=A0A9X0CVF5_9CNID|nr:hypothetical protein OS493_005186 [Desmophyllum pertusum]